MERPDANRIALRATRAILQAAHDFRFDLAGKTIDVRCTKQPAPAWPQQLAGLDETIDGPWPTPVTVEASWEDGSSRLFVQAGYMKPADTADQGVGLHLGIAETRRQVLWTTLTNYLRQQEDGTTAAIQATVFLNRSDPEEDPASYAAHNEQLRSLIAGVIPMRTAAWAEICSVEVPSGRVIPDAATAFERVVIIGIAKHAWFERRHRRGFRGRPFVEVRFATASTSAALAPALPANPEADQTARPSEKRAGIWPLPGGVRAYMSTLHALLKDIAEREPLPFSALDNLFAEQYQATGSTAVKGYRNLLRSLGFATASAGALSLTSAGRAWLAAPNPAALFDQIHDVFLGMIEALVLAQEAPTLPTPRAAHVLRQVLDVTWETFNQVAFRRNWLLSLGLTDRTAAGDAITPKGAEVLAAHPEEAEAARVAIRQALAASEVNHEDEGDDDDEATPEIAPGGPAATSPEAPPGWMSEHLDLSAETISTHLGRLRLADSTVQQLAAAVSSGKHILFVGPPGTGKTELAVALSRAAAAEGYCEGLFTATASADWTTFDTIGGYAMQKDQTLAFRPGAFLRAVSERKWLLVDELNRADVDRAFGELMTVLAGQGTDTHYELEGGRRVSIGAEETRTFRVPRCFRVLATMNIWDKTSLFRLSYAVQRRFALINVGLPPDAVYAGIMEAAASEGALLPPLAPALLPPLVRFFSADGILAEREMGPAVAIDVIRYLRRRGDVADGVAEALEMFVLPQLQGLSERAAKDAREHCEEAVGAGVSGRARESLRTRFLELFPGLNTLHD